MEGDLLTDYEEFVNEVTSYASKNPKNFIDEIDRIEEQGVNPARLLTASVGLSGESGEFSDIVKKVVFQGKEIDDDVVKHLRSELGDIMWYVAQGCLALDTTIEELIDINVAKLESRYPGGFSMFRSENRRKDDI
jgi:NTP pyrophosphatase (non-canonical NTP hydrolase)